jgi:hypothetical protein
MFFLSLPGICNNSLHKLPGITVARFWKNLMPLAPARYARKTVYHGWSRNILVFLENAASPKSFDPKAARKNRGNVVQPDFPVVGCQHPTGQFGR